MLTRLLYSAAWYLAMPLVLARLWWRGRKEPGYRRFVGERLGMYKSTGSGNWPVIWVHAVSVGETRAAQPLVEALLSAYPRHTVLLTHMTPTGRATGNLLFSEHASRFVQAYLPYDTGYLAGRFIRHFAPRLCILMETEVWPNLIAQCAARGVPVALVNARLSERSLAKARRFSALIAPAARAISCVAAQTEADARRLRDFGAGNVQVTGSIKFDVTPPDSALAKGDALRARIGARPVLLCSTTRDGEEALILDAFDALDVTDVLLVIVPRHPQRFEAVTELVVARGWKPCLRSSLGKNMTDGSLSPEVKIFIGDSMGEMFSYYQACDLAFIGGSLLPLGGHNLIEACAIGKPVLIGEHTFNFGTITEEAVAAGAALRVADAQALMQQASRLLQDVERCHAMGKKAQAFAMQHRGATERTMVLLAPLLAYSDSHQKQQ